MNGALLTRANSFLLTVWLVGFASPAWSAPQIKLLSLHGLQAGATTTLTLAGEDLAGSPKLLLPVPIAEQTLQPGSTDKQAIVAVTLAADVPAGIYPLRVASAHGISEPVLIGVDTLPQKPLVASVEQLPVALHGTLSGSSSARVTFTGRAQQSMVIDVESHRLGSKLRPVLRLLDPGGLPIAWSQAHRPIAGDARITALLPRDGTYTVELHDAAYQAGSPGHFRLKIGELRYADFTLPTGLRRNEPGRVQLVGSQMSALDVAATTAPFATAIDWHQVPLASGERPWLFTSNMPEYTEPDSAAAIQEVSAPPLGISGVVWAAREQDVFEMPVTPGAKLRFEVIAHRIGSLLDAVLTLTDAEGKVLVTVDDVSGVIDPQLDFTVPDGVEKLRVAVRDLTRRGGEDYVYRLEVTAPDAPRFQITSDRAAYTIPQQGSALVSLSVTRLGYTGPIALDFGLLPSGVTLHPTSIPAGAERALVTLTSENIAPTAWSTFAIARSDSPDSIPDTAVMASPAASRFIRPWLANHLTLATTEAAPLRVAMSELQSPVEQGAQLAAQVKLTRQGAEGQVRLSLITSQIVPQMKVTKDGKEEMVPDLERALRLEDEPTVAADTDELSITILVPADLPGMAYDVVLKAELLSDDGKQVVATALTPVTRLQVEVKPPQLAVVVFEDEADFPDRLTDGGGDGLVTTDDKHTESASLKILPDQLYNRELLGTGLKIRENPQPGEFRYLRFAWKKVGGETIQLQLSADGDWGPDRDAAGKSFRYHAGPGDNYYGKSTLIAPQLPSEWVVVTRDLFADFGEFTLTGLAFTPVDGEYALFDHVLVGRTVEDLDRLKP